MVLRLRMIGYDGRSLAHLVEAAFVYKRVMFGESIWLFTPWILEQIIVSWWLYDLLGT